MRVYGFKKDEQGFMDIENTLQAEQEWIVNTFSDKFF